MGANSSTRKITLLHDEKAGVIKLSESLAHRLRGQLEEKTSESLIHSEPKITPFIQPPPGIESYKEKTPEKDSYKKSIESKKLGESIPTRSVHSRDDNLIFTKLKEEKELELKHNDQEWREKFIQREKEFIHMNKLTQNHLNETIKEVESLFMKVSCTPVCQEQQQKVFNCYQTNKTQSLRCSDEVESFARCVNLSRLQSITNEKAS